jgi:LPXTG-motif cell wall-anchored protein
MGKGSSSSSADNSVHITDNSTTQNFENVGKLLSDGSIDASSTTYNYNLASDEKLDTLANALQNQSTSTAAVAKEAQESTNTIVASLQQTKSSMFTFAGIALIAITGIFALLIFKRKKR